MEFITKVGAYITNPPLELIEYAKGVGMCLLVQTAELITNITTKLAGG